MRATRHLRSKLYKSACWLFLGGLFLSYSSKAEAPLDVRVALVIGNAAYKNFPSLSNPANDARSMSVVLRKLGFHVVEMVDGSKSQMVRAIEQMQSLLHGKNAVGMLYYAGHGLQLDWRNYMVPVDAQLSQASDVPQHTIDIENVIGTFKKSATRMNIIVLDACRDNPFSGKVSSKGLAQLDAPAGTYLAFATSPGNVAEDGDESAGNGLFTQYLLKELQRPARIEEVFKRVRYQVRQKSQGRQIPWDSSSLEDDFSFNDGVKYTFKPEDLLKEVQQAKDRERQPQQAAHQTTPAKLSTEQMREQQFAQEKAQWDKIKDSANKADFYDFLNQYPSGLISELASAKIEILDKAKIKPQADKLGMVQDYAAQRFAPGDVYEFVGKDGYTGATRWTQTFTILKVDEEGADVQGVRSNAPSWQFRVSHAGAQHSDNSGKYDPPVTLMPAGLLQVGYKWFARTNFTSARTRQQEWLEVSGKVVARESIQIPAGRFDTFKLEVHMQYQSGARMKLTMWTDPAIGSNLKSIAEYRPVRGNADITVRELVSFRRGG